MPYCNTTLTDERIDEEPIWKSVQFHHIGLVVSAVFGLIAVVIALWLMFKHATHYSKPFEQRQIIRILFMIPIYATVSFLSYLFYQHAIYYEVLRDCYEAFAIASFFTLLCGYLGPDLHEQKIYFRGLTPKNWLLPINWIQKCSGGREKGPFRVPQSGLTWFNVIWIGVFQYCFIRVFFTIVSVATEATGRYCESSLHPGFAHVWVMVFEGVSVTIAMYCLIQFYYQLKGDLASHSPGFKIICIKLVIFFSFWQTLVISFLVSSNTITPTNKIQYPDIKVGIPSMLLCIEMAIFATMHIWAFSWKEYDLSRRVDPLSNSSGYATPKYLGAGKAVIDAFNPWDVVKATGRGFRWLFIGVKNRRNDVSYQKGTTMGDLEQNTVYNGPTFAGNGAPAVATGESEATPYNNDYKSSGYGKLSTDNGDERVLLDHQQTNPQANQYTPYPIPNVANPYATPSNPDALPSHPTTGYESVAAQSTRPPAPGRDFSWENGAEAQEWGTVSTSGVHVPANHVQTPPTASRPPYPEAGGQWDMFGGASGQAPRR